MATAKAKVKELRIVWPEIFTGLACSSPNEAFVSTYSSRRMMRREMGTCVLHNEENICLITAATRQGLFAAHKYLFVVHTPDVF